MPATEESSVIKRLGVIAGGGTLPGLLLHACDRQNIDVFVVGFEGQTDPALYEGRQFMNSRIGAAGKIIQTLKSHGIHDLVMIGAMRRPSIKELNPDFKTAQFFAKVAIKALGDDGLLKAARAALESEGFRLHGVQRFANDLLTAEGPVGHYKPKKEDMPDIHRGIDVVRALGRLDVGQAAIVQEGMILGVEGAEGTNELIRRCGAYRRKGRGPIMVKLAKPEQDFDLDLPAFGPETVKVCADSGICGIVLDAGRSLLIDPQAVAELADRHKIFVVGIDPQKLAHES